MNKNVCIDELYLTLEEETREQRKLALGTEEDEIAVANICKLWQIENEITKTQAQIERDDRKQAFEEEFRVKEAKSQRRTDAAVKIGTAVLSVGGLVGVALIGMAADSEGVVTSNSVKNALSSVFKLINFKH